MTDDLSWIADGAVREALTGLHESARGDRDRWQTRPRDSDDSLVRMGEMFLALSPAEGRLLHMLARISGARRIVEFGASYGVSTLYLSLAARAAGGTLTTTEVHPDKIGALHDLFAQARVEDVVTLLEGDACKTLQTLSGPVDLLFLDGWKSLYMPVHDIVRPMMAPGGVIVADNIDQEGARPYAAFANDPASGLLTQRIEGLCVSLVVG